MAHRDRAGELPVMEVALACGFVSPSHFAKCYRERYDQVPKSTRLGVPPNNTKGDSRLVSQGRMG